MVVIMHRKCTYDVIWVLLHLSIYFALIMHMYMNLKAKVRQNMHCSGFNE